ncbi:hypothetical protein LTR97_009530 [Elasticomyces elasticus]|uniref:Uncharacterized protein n=1 Tax=Elasticomyces elasticus TaxID=574655 RepID=A0AAN7WAL8_9PEZI|nr:hypothetical protein LTR97_009530 [Elasticomyces elasticus]
MNLWEGFDITLYVAVMPNMLSMEYLGTNTFAVEVEEGVTNWEFSPLTNVSSFQQLGTPLKGSVGGRIQPLQLFEGATLLQCDMVNVSYSAAITYRDRVQDIQVSRDMTKSSQPVTALNTLYFPNLTGGSNGSCSNLEDASKANSSLPCFLNPVPLQQLAYQSVFTAYAQLILGAVSGSGSYSGLSGLLVNTTVMTTVLALSEEMSTIRTSGRPNETLQASLRLTHETTLHDLANDQPQRALGSLKMALEQAFENVTISILSDPYLQPKTSSPFAPSLSTNVTVDGIATFYVYDRVTLGIAYGLAILFSTLAVAAGMVFLLLSGASYDTTFSTIVRVAKAADLSVELKDDEGTGSQPLPKRLAKARLVINASLSQQVEMLDRGKGKQQPVVETNSLLAASDGSYERSRGH